MTRMGRIIADKNWKKSAKIRWIRVIRVIRVLLTSTLMAKHLW
jgi:hypothetical protein